MPWPRPSATRSLARTPTASTLTSKLLIFFLSLNGDRTSSGAPSVRGPIRPIAFKVRGVGAVQAAAEPLVELVDARPAVAGGKAELHRVDHHLELRRVDAGQRQVRLRVAAQRHDLHALALLPRQLLHDDHPEDHAERV